MWAAKWQSNNKLDGKLEHLIVFDFNRPLLFHTRKECRAWIEAKYGYIKRRPDLRGEPHGWRLPIPVRVKVTEARRRGIR